LDLKELKRRELMIKLHNKEVRSSYSATNVSVNVSFCLSRFSNETSYFFVYFFASFIFIITLFHSLDSAVSV
jgi:hypothetical protein